MKTIKVSTINQEGQVAGEEKLPEEIFSQEASPYLLAQAVRVYLSNQRKALAKAKTRGEVDGSGAKIWRQKGTGHARHGDRQAPIFVGGGVAHGPRGNQNYQKKINEKMNRKAIFSVLSDKQKEKKIFLLEDFSFDKTKKAAEFLNKVKQALSLKGKISFLLGNKDVNLKKSLQNLSEVSILKANSLNIYALLKTDYIFLTKNSLGELVSLIKKDENH